LPQKGVYLVKEFISLIIAPLFVGLVLLLVSRKLDEKDDD
jgi:hypothetical protein